MFFQIIPVKLMSVVPPHDQVVKRRWVYRQGTEQKPGAEVCQSSTMFDDVPAARKDIAAARKAFGGSRFAKVVESDA